MKRIFVIALAILMLFPVLVACADPSQGNDTTTPSDATSAPSSSTTAPDAQTSERLYPTLPDVNYGDTEFNVLYYDPVARHGWTFIPNDIEQEGDNGEPLAASVYKRNVEIESRFGVKIKCFVPQGESMTSALTASIMVGDDLFSMVDICMNEVGSLFNKGLLTTIDALDVDYDMPWFDGKSIDSFTIGGRRLACVSDAIYFDKMSTVVTLYNRAMGDSIGIGSLYQTVRDGSFTLDGVLAYAEQVSADLNNDGKMDKNDAYCISCQNDGAYFMLHSSGTRIVENDGSTLTFNINNEQGISMLEKIYKIMTDNTIYFNRMQPEKITPTQSAEMFANGQTLFMMRPLQTLYDLRAFKCDFEILPMPKFSENQTEYCSPVNTYSATCLCVPKGTKDYGRTSVILEALCAESHYEVMPVLYDVVLDVKLANSPESAEVLDTVFENRIYDIGMMWNIGNVRNKITEANPATVASTLKSMERVALTNIKNLLKQMEGIE